MWNDLAPIATASDVATVVDLQLFTFVEIYSSTCLDFPAKLVKYPRHCFPADEQMNSAAQPK